MFSPDQTFEILINDESARKGSLLEDFSPAVNPPSEIDDPEDFKPETWVDIAEIEDETASKPADWDEDAPVMIVDTSASKPADWLETESESIPDPEAEKPEEWDVSSSWTRVIDVVLIPIRTRRMETGSRLWCRTLSARMLQDVDHGLSQRSGTQSTR
jgi:hypothetical protein